VLIKDQLSEFISDKLEPLQQIAILQTVNHRANIPAVQAVDIRQIHAETRLLLIKALKTISQMQSEIVTLFYSANNLSAEAEESMELFKQSVLLVHRAPAALAAAMLESARRRRFQDMLGGQCEEFRASVDVQISQEQARRETFHQEISHFLPTILYKRMYLLLIINYNI
jgi:hypothetical protein